VSVVTTSTPKALLTAVSFNCGEDSVVKLVLTACSVVLGGLGSGEDVSLREGIVVRRVLTPSDQPGVLDTMLTIPIEFIL
jgi:hypothetical protein